MQEHVAGSLRESTVLYSWVQHRISLYMDILQQHLPNITEGGNLASVLEHCMYCGSSLSRVGLDFQGLLQPAYQLCMLRLFSANLALAVEAFNARLESHKWLSMPAPVFGKPKNGSDRKEGGTNNADDISPPYVLMEHLPLAVFVNGVLSALNELRHCAMLALQNPLAGLLQAALEQVAASMVHFKHSRALAETEAALFVAAAKALSGAVLSYLATCFGRIFPGGNLQLNAANIAQILKDVWTD